MVTRFRIGFLQVCPVTKYVSGFELGEKSNIREKKKRGQRPTTVDPRQVNVFADANIQTFLCLYKSNSVLRTSLSWFN
jgi:hypothetical protein